MILHKQKFWEFFGNSKWCFRSGEVMKLFAQFLFHGRIISIYHGKIIAQVSDNTTRFNMFLAM